MADTKEFDVIQIARSDGLDTGPGYWPITNAPVASTKKPAKDALAAEKTPRSKPQMVRLAEDDQRFIEWRVKLGILLKQELSPNPEEGKPWYVVFPRGYWLYERSKHLWVSGYPVKAKLFKSSQEFAIHLIWLLSPSRDYRDCCCVHCNVPNLSKSVSSVDDGLTTTPHESKREKTPPKVTPVPLPTVVGQPAQKQASTAEQPTSDRPAQAAHQHDASLPANVPPESGQQARLQSSTNSMPQPVPWLLKSQLMFRSGEMVWYQTGATWRLGVIAVVGNGNYEILPLGHELVPQPNKTKTDNEMRPFHAFSVPPVAVPELKGKTFGDVPWEAMFSATGNDPPKVDHLNLDASKMAAAKIDWSYSLWTRLPGDQGSKTTAYYGAFFGAERVEIGDCLRIKALPAELNISADSVLLGLRGIFTTTDYPGGVFFRGHVYRAVKGGGAATANVAPRESLPVALRDEAQWRNNLNPAQPFCYSLVMENVVLKEQSISGRFYPAHRLLPILDPAAFQALVARRQVDEPYLNSRMEGAGRYIGRKRNRIDSLGATVPKGAGISLEPHVGEEAFHAYQGL